MSKKLRFLPALFTKSIRKGRLTLVGPDGSEHVAGAGSAEGEDQPDIRIRIHDASLDWKIPLNPELKAAEAYMDGTLEIEQGDVYGLLLLFYRNRKTFDATPGQVAMRGMERKLRRFHQHNSLLGARKHVKHHYDLKDELFELFLDEDKQYSCAYYPTGNETLEEAQRAKKEHIIRKLNLKDGQSVLEIGCGWGGLALDIAREAEVEVTGVTLSDNQARIANQRAEAAGVADRVTFKVQDYRHLDTTFDRVVSVGMLEHVGARHLKEYFFQVRDLLSTEGLALIHSISTKSPPGITSPFLRKYIFPNGYSPSMSEVVSTVETTGLWILDVEVWRRHYGYTLREWQNRFQARREEAIAMYDERFARMWEFYLAACEGAFMEGSSNVIQLQIARDAEAVPITRDYLYR